MTKKSVPIAWESLEDAFENNARQVHSFLHVDTGEVLRLVDGSVDPELLHRVRADALYLPVDPVSSREQYRWMEHFIQTVEEPALVEALTAAIDGKGAFRRFKDVLMSHPVDRERWFKFRSERLRDCMNSWLETQDIEPTPRPEWKVPTAADVEPELKRRNDQSRAHRGRARRAEVDRARLHALIDKLPSRALDSALAFLEFLMARRPLPLPRVDGLEGVEGSEGSQDPEETTAQAGDADGDDALVAD